MNHSFARIAAFGLLGLVSVDSGCRNAAKAPPATAGATAAPVQNSAEANAATARGLLAQGRTAMRTELAGAITAFTAAQKLTPEDPELLAELGLLQFYSGELDRARDTITAALRAAQTPAQTAAPAYNLGLLEEAAGNIAPAVAAFELAAAARPGPVLQKHLDDLKAVLEQGKAEPLAGPFASLPAVCDALKTLQQTPKELAKDLAAACGTEPCEVGCPLQELGSLTGSLPPPISEVRVFWSRVRGKSDVIDAGPAPDQWRGEPRCGLVNTAVRLDKQWFVAASLGSFCYSKTQQGNVQLARIAVESVGSSKLVTVSLDATQDYQSGSAGNSSLTVIGVGKSKKPARIGPILRATYGSMPAAEAAAKGPKAEEAIQASSATTYEWRFADGALQITGQTVDSTLGPHKRQTKAPLTLRYPLVFP